ncbi:hypothetical protein G6F23_014733 [Rhizopus arrhizus]|nr:hypothetical protein G6F23_014733 [Rhizopus arrhizus]
MRALRPGAQVPERQRVRHDDGGRKPAHRHDTARAALVVAPRVHVGSAALRAGSAARDGAGPMPGQRGPRPVTRAATGAGTGDGAGAGAAHRAAGRAYGGPVAG